MFDNWEPTSHKSGFSSPETGFFPFYLFVHSVASFSCLTHDIFISYTQADKHTAFAIYDALTHGGMSVWIAGSATNGVKAGNAYKNDIVKAISACKIFLLIYSQYVNKSRDVKNELTLAEKKVIITVRLDQSEMCPELQYDLKNLEFIDADRGGLPYVISRLLNDIPHQLEINNGRSDLSADKVLRHKAKLVVRLKQLARVIGIPAGIAGIFIYLFYLSQQNYIPDKESISDKKSTIIPDSLFVSGIVRARTADTGIANAWITSNLTPGDTLITTTDGTFEFKVPGKPGENVRIYAGAQGYITRNEYHTLPKAISIYLDKQ